MGLIFPPWTIITRSITFLAFSSQLMDAHFNELFLFAKPSTVPLGFGQPISFFRITSKPNVMTDELCVFWLDF